MGDHSFLMENVKREKLWFDMDFSRIFEIIRGDAVNLPSIDPTCRVRRAFPMGAACNKMVSEIEISFRSA